MKKSLNTFFLKKFEIEYGKFLENPKFEEISLSENLCLKIEKKNYHENLLNKLK